MSTKKKGLPATIRERLLPRHAFVIGSGSWGTGIAFSLASAGLRVTLWARSEEVADSINNERRNKRYLPTCELPKNIKGTTSWDAMAKADLVFFVVPSVAFRDMAKAALASGKLRPGALLLTATKGIEKETGKRMSEILEEEIPDHPIGVLSGPNHAEEVGGKLPTAGVLGCPDIELAADVQEVLTLPWLRTYTSTDVAGIELGGAIKNVFAIAAGIVDGLGLGDNAKAALVTRGLAEMTRLGTAMGGQPETFAGLSGMGDLVATCYSEHSRNYYFGRELGSGRTLDSIVGSMTMVAEGVPNTESIYAAARKANVRTPLIDQVYAILYQDKAAADALSELFSRDPRPELDHQD